MNMNTQEDTRQIIDASALLEHPDPFHIPYKTVQTLQLKLLQHRFAQNRNRIPVLQRAADRKGIHAIADLQDAVALLFSHATYKSYPESFLDTGQWARMNQWVATLSTRGDELRQIDVSRVSGLDDWLTRLDQHGFALCHSSGTSGKPSFIPKSASEQTLMCLACCLSFKFGQGVDPQVDKMPIIAVTFRSGWNTIIRLFPEIARAYTISPTTTEYAFDEAQSPSVMRNELKMKRLIAEGRVTPGELAAFEQARTERQAALAIAFQDFVQRTLAYRGQRVMLLGHTATAFQLAAKGQAMGEEGIFAPDSLILHGGGKKGAALPANYEDLMAHYYGVPRQNVVDLYGMTERNSIPLVCEYGRKHCSPWEIPLILDREGQYLLNTEFGNGGEVTGRYAFVDLLASTYWGGFTTGDRVKVSFDRCPCGREGPQILEIARYKDLPDAPDEDKLSCAAEMASYVFAELAVS